MPQSLQGIQMSRGCVGGGAVLALKGHMGVRETRLPGLEPQAQSGPAFAVFLNDQIVL